MIKTPITLQDLRRKLYVKAKAEPHWRFWGLYVHVCKMETLREAYEMAKENDGAPGIDGMTFEAIEAQGVDALLEQIRDELTGRTYQPLPARKQEIPKDGGNKVRVLSIPAIRDRVVQGALKLILEPVFEADFQPGSFGYRPKKTAHDAIERVAEAIVQRKTRVRRNGQGHTSPQGARVADECVGKSEEIDQAVPIGVVARQSRDLQPEHETNVSKSYFGGQSCKPGASNCARAGQAKVLIDDDNAVGRPSQVAGLRRQCVLPLSRPTVVLDLSRAGLAQIDDGDAVKVTGGDFLDVTHRAFPWLVSTEASEQSGERESPSLRLERWGRSFPTGLDAALAPLFRFLETPTSTACSPSVPLVDSASRRRRASTMVRVASKSETAQRTSPSFSEGGDATSRTAPPCRSVQLTGMNDRVPSGSSARMCGVPLRIKDLNTTSRLPSKAWRFRVMTTVTDSS